MTTDSSDAASRQPPSAAVPPRGQGEAATLPPRMDAHAFGIALGTVIGALLLAATLALALVGDSAATSAGAAPGLPGFGLSLLGAVIGGIYGWVFGYLTGYGFARLRNAAVAAYLRFVWSRLQHHLASDFLDRVS